MRRRREKGQALLLVVVAVGLLLVGAMGLALDTSQLYGHRQMAQAAADAAAEAAILSIYGGTNTGTNAFGTGTLNCVSGGSVSSVTPCAYAATNGFGASGTSTDTITVTYPTSVAGVGSLSPDFTPAAVHVVVTRPVQSTLIRLLGAGASKTIQASATAAILKVTSPIPIVVLHPTLDASFSLSGGGSGSACPSGSTANICICGGPQLSIQVNSRSSSAVSVGGTETVDLSKGGPLDTGGNCSTGRGTDFGVFGGPSTATSTTYPSWLTPTGSKTHYLSHNPPLDDPLKGVAPPTSAGLTDQTSAMPITSGTGTTPGTGDCPSAAAGCQIYKPGLYRNGIGVKGAGAGAGTIGIFHPGIYFIQGPGSGSFNGVGFGTGANGGMIMCSTTCVADTSGCCSAGGMMVYLDTNGGIFSIAANSGANLLGSDPGSSYKGILFFGARDAPTHNSSGSHQFGGGGSLSLQGTIYVTNTKALMLAGTAYQNVRLRGKTGSNTTIQGEIIVSTLDVGGGGAIQMNLNANTSYFINQVALVQ